MVNTIVIVLDVLSALFLIVTILLHSGRGSGLSDMFGGGGGLSGAALTHDYVELFNRGTRRAHHLAVALGSRLVGARVGGNAQVLVRVSHRADRLPPRLDRPTVEIRRPR